MSPENQARFNRLSPEVQRSLLHCGRALALFEGGLSARTALRNAHPIYLQTKDFGLR